MATECPLCPHGCETYQIDSFNDGESSLPYGIPKEIYHPYDWSKIINPTHSFDYYQGEDGEYQL